MHSYAFPRSKRLSRHRERCSGSPKPKYRRRISGSSHVRTLFRPIPRKILFWLAKGNRKENHENPTILEGPQKKPSPGQNSDCFPNKRDKITPQTRKVTVQTPHFLPPHTAHAANAADRETLSPATPERGAQERAQQAAQQRGAQQHRKDLQQPAQDAAPRRSCLNVAQDIEEYSKIANKKS